jgi:hypothetical protein
MSGCDMCLETFIKVSNEKFCSKCEESKKFFPIRPIKIFDKKTFVIEASFVPFIIQNPSILDNLRMKSEFDYFYYKSNNEAIERCGSDMVYGYHLKNLFRRENINIDLSHKINKVFYKPYESMIGIFQTEINSNTGLVASIDGVTKDTDCIAISFANCSDTYCQYLETIALAAMSVYSSSTAFCYIEGTDTLYEFKFNTEKWLTILNKLKEINSTAQIPKDT